MKIRNIMVPSYHSKVGSTQKWETHFSVLVMEFVLYLHVWVKSKVFSITLSRQSLSTFNVCMKMENELYVFLTRFTLFCCFMKMFHSLQIQGILVSPWCNYSCRALQELDQDNFYSSDWKKLFLLFKLSTAYPQEKSCLTN